LQKESYFSKLADMKLEQSKWNGCPIRYAAELVADKWTFLILRDLMFRGKSSYNALLQSSESISTNILADRLKKLEQHGLLSKQRDLANRKQFIYSLTTKGTDLIPVMLGFFEWSYKYDEKSYLSAPLVEKIQSDIQGISEEFKSGKVIVLNSTEP